MTAAAASIANSANPKASVPRTSAVKMVSLDALRAAGVDLSAIEGKLSLIESIKGREVLDSRGNPTVEVDLVTQGGIFARAIVPSGASTGIHEACELRAGDKKRYLGKGCLKAIEAVNGVLAKELKGMCVKDQRALDDKMKALDGTANKSNLGANAILGVSMAATKAAAEAKGIPLYRQIAELAGNGGKMVLPVPCFNVIEGGFAPPIDAKGGVDLICEAIEKAGYKDKCKIGMDVAASEFKVEGEDCYDLGLWYPEAERSDPALKMTGKQLGDFYASLCKDYPMITIEDPFDQDDWQAWTDMTTAVGGPTQVVGDDLTVTNVTRVQKAIDTKACNALLLKVNQIGSVSEAIDAVKLCKQNGWGVMCSHRSGETEDVTIADLAVGLCTGQIKTGASCRSDRNAKYNQLMRIEEELGSNAVYAGTTWRKPAWMAA